MIGIFCELCGKIMNIENNTCKCSCGFMKEINSEEIEITENITKKEKAGEGFIEDKNELATFPHKCKKCNFEKAQVIDLGVWIGDEAGVIRYKCGKCGYTEQEKGSNS